MCEPRTRGERVYVHGTAKVGSGVYKALDQDVGIGAFVNPKPIVVKDLGAVDDRFTASHE